MEINIGQNKMIDPKRRTLMQQRKELEILNTYYLDRNIFNEYNKQYNTMTQIFTI